MLKQQFTFCSAANLITKGRYLKASLILHQLEIIIIRHRHEPMSHGITWYHMVFELKLKASFLI